MPSYTLGRSPEEPQQPGGATDPHHEQPGGHRIERAGMADLLRALGPTHDRDRVVRRDALGLVDQEQAVGPGHGATGSPFSAPIRRATVSAGPWADV